MRREIIYCPFCGSEMKHTGMEYYAGYEPSLYEYKCDRCGTVVANQTKPQEERKE